MLWRACVGWATLPLGGILLALLMPLMPVFTAAAVVLALVVWSAARPGRGLQDTLAGTCLVPR